MTPTVTPEVARLAEERRRALEAIAEMVGDRTLDERGRATYSFDSWGLEAFARELAAKQDAAPTSASTVPEWISLYDQLGEDRIDKIADFTVRGMEDGIRGFMKTWGWQQFSRELLKACEVARNPGACSVTDGEANPSIPLSAIRPISVEAIREVMGCPDVIGTDGASLVEALEQVAQAAAKRLGMDGEAKK